MLKIIFSLLMINNAFSMLHQLPATDDDMKMIGNNYPCVGQVIETHYLQDQIEPRLIKSTGTLIELSGYEHLSGQLVLVAKHSLQSWLQASKEFTFKVTSEEGDEQVYQIINFFTMPDLIVKPVYGLTLYEKRLTRDIGIAVLDRPIESIIPLKIFPDSFDAISNENIITTVGYGYNGRLDLGIVIPNDGAKRGIQFLKKEIKSGRPRYGNPTKKGQPIFFHKKYNPFKKTDDQCIRGSSYHGDSGAPLITTIAGQHYIIGVLRGAQRKYDEKPKLSSMIKCVLKIENIGHEFNDHISFTKKILINDLEHFLKTNSSEVPTTLVEKASPNFHLSIASEIYESVVGIEECLLPLSIQLKLS